MAPSDSGPETITNQSISLSHSPRLTFQSQLVFVSPVFHRIHRVTRSMNAPRPTTRRRFLRSSLAASLAATSAPFVLPSARAAEILETRIISPQPQYYHGWSTVARRANGDLWLVWSGGREAHVCPFGQVCAMTSTNNGASWSWPRVLLDGPLDDRDAGIVETAKGSLLATTFTSLAYESILEKAQRDASWPADKLARWKAAQDRLSPEQRRSDLGQWILRSTDGGITWSERLPSLVNSPHGPIALRNGRLLYPGKKLWDKSGDIGVAESFDDGLTWRWLAAIPTRPGDQPADEYHELHGVEAANDDLIVHIRKERGANNNETLQSESSDGGKTWTTPHTIGVWGIPSHLLRLRDGRLLMSYGYRRKPFGNQARVSSDHGKSWSEPIPISIDGAGGDLGYPSTVELGDGTLLTVWYEKLATQSAAVLRQAKWRL